MAEKRSGWLLPAAAALCGCLAPRYVRPPVEAPASYKELPGAAAEWKEAKPADLEPRGKWWQRYGDSRLDGLEEKLLAANPSLAQAEAIYREAHALVTVNRSAFFPTAGVNFSAQRSYGSSAGSAPRSQLDNFALFGTASWEPDLWGQVRYGVQNAKAQAQAAAAQAENVKLVLESELASDYFQAEALDMEQADLLEATSSYMENLALTQTRFKDGVASEVDVAQAESQLATTRAQSADVALSRAQTEHAIAVLVGENPAFFSLSTGAIRGEPPPVPTGVPSELLQRRPDVAQAERLVAAANANIGLQRSAYFPALTLSAIAGYATPSLSNLFDWPNRFWSLGASAAETLLDFGRRRGLNEQAKAAYDAAVGSYRQTALAAFQEVEDNLSGLALLSQETAQEEAAYRAAADALKLELLRYKAGVVSYIDVITQQNLALTAQRAADVALGRRMTADVLLVRALGGGWKDDQLPKN